MKTTVLAALSVLLLTTAQPASGGSEATLCTVNGTSYNEGQIVPSGDPCLDCICGTDGNRTCVNRLDACKHSPPCPPNTRLEFFIAEDGCCPIANCSRSCKLNDIIYEIGETIPSGNPCRSCICHESTRIICEFTLCGPSPPCPFGTELESVSIPGKCCPERFCRKICTGNGTEGQIVPSEDPCLECMCGVGGNITCVNHSVACDPPDICPPGTEPEPVRVQGECCPTYDCRGFCTPLNPCGNGGACDEIADNCTCPSGYSGELCSEGCNIDGIVYERGQRVPSPTPCERCICAVRGFISCEIMLCPPPFPCPPGTKPAAVSPPGGECCQIYLCVTTCNINGTSYADGEDVPSSDPCEECRCSSRDVICRNISHLCPPPDQCPLGNDLVIVNVTGECCPGYSCSGPPPPIESLTPPPVVVSFRYDPDHPDMVRITWRPISRDEHANVSLDGYYIEVSRDRNDSDVVASGTAGAGETSFALSVGENSDMYWVRIKAVKGSLDISEFSDWFAITSSQPVVVNGRPVLQGWAIAVIVLAFLILCLLCFIVLCFLLLCIAKKARKGEIQVEKKDDVTGGMEMTYQL